MGGRGPTPGFVSGGGGAAVDGWIVTKPICRLSSLSSRLPSSLAERAGVRACFHAGARLVEAVGGARCMHACKSIGKARYCKAPYILSEIDISSSATLLPFFLTSFLVHPYPLYPLSLSLPFSFLIPRHSQRASNLSFLQLVKYFVVLYAVKQSEMGEGYIHKIVSRWGEVMKGGG